MKRFIKSLTVFALVFTMLLGSTQPILAVTHEELNNKSDTSVSVKQVNETENTGSFRVNCAGTEDEIKVYQVATMEWNTDSFDEPQWVNAVSTWLTGNGSSYATFTTPALLATQSESVQGDFFKALIHEENGIINADGLQKWSSDAADASDGYITDSGIVVEKDDNGDEKTDAYSIVNVPLGIYVIVGSSGAKTYAPAVVNLIPDRDPTGKWYVDNNIEATMKAADAYMHKFINGKKTDIVTIGEEVDFTIEFPLPEYIDRGNQAIYTLTFDDVLSDAFTLDTDSVVIKYRTDASTSWEEAAELSKDYYTALIAAPAPANNPDGYGITVWGCGYHHLKYYTDSSKTSIIEYVIYRNKYKDPVSGTDKYAYYYYKEGAYHVIYDSTTQYDKTNLSALQAKYKELTGDATGHSFVQFNADGTVNGNGGSTSPTEVQELFEGKNGYQYVASLFHNIFNITFNYNKLIENDLHNQNVDIQITYEAQVNKNIEVNSENNTNTATMKYEINAAGDKFATISDTVKAYTYGLNLVKMDGDTYQTTQARDAQGNPRFEADGETPIYVAPKYLEGAKFYVFKETDTFIGETYKGSMPGSPDAKDLDEDTTLTEYKADHTGDGQYYYYTYQATEDATLDNGVSVTSGDTVTRVFKLVVLEDKTYGTYFDGTLTSDDEAEGVTVKGLDEGNYIVSEYLAPTGYNLLAEDMMFSIYKISDNKAEEQAGSYKLFSGNQTGDELDDDGLYTMNVLNYAGLTLPSTGGMGTMLFTMIGILLMVAAIVVIMMKNKKNMRYAAEFMAILLVVGMLFQLTPQNVYAVTEVKLNNEYGSAVTGDNKVNFTVNIKNAGDTLEVYKIAEMKYENDTYNGPSWVTGVQQKLEGSDYAAYTTPALLGEASIDDQVAFLEWLYTNKDTNNLEQNQKVPAVNITESVGGEQITVSNVDYGIYLVKAVNTISGKNYQLLTVNAIPTQEGPLGAWYIKDNISATLKFADIKVEKTINNEDGITVSMGDEVEFKIVGEVPDYPGVDTVDNEGDPIKDFSNYFFAMNDTMSDSFEFDREKDIVIEYTVDNSEWLSLPEEAYESLFVSAAKDLNSVGVRRYKDNLTNNDIYCIVSGPDASNSNRYTFDFYVYTEEYGTYTKFYTYNSSTNITYYGQSITASAVLTPYKNTTGRTSATTLTALSTSEWTDINNIVFDYEKLHDLGVKYVRVTYNAVVTPEVVVGADDNTNTATFHYQKDLSGAGGSSSDTAYAWTYGLNIVKKDGDETSTYLANARFKLYQEAYIYVPSSDSADKTDDTYTEYEFLMNVDETTDVPTGIISAEPDAEAVNLDTLEKLNSVINGDYYYRYVAYEADTCGVDSCEMKDAAHSHVHVYKFIGVNGDATSEIVSAADASGVTVKGLAPASYVLIETSAPTGYNKLQEALRFEIQELTVDQASALGHRTEDGKVSLKGFASDETYEKTQIESDTSLKYAQVGDGDEAVYYKVYEDGIYPIEVENFKGLTLPSTGGMGTLFFTLIGLFVMTAALVVIIAKRNGQKYIEY